MEGIYIKKNVTRPWLLSNEFRYNRLFGDEEKEVYTYRSPVLMYERFTSLECELRITLGEDAVTIEDYEEVFSEEEMPVIMKYLEENPDMMNLGILLMFVTGVRIGEVVSLKHEDFEGSSFKIRRTETRFTDENGKYVHVVKEFPKSQAGVRTVIIPDAYEWLAKAVKFQNPFCEYIFVKDGERISTQAMRMRLKRICKKLNIYHKVST